MRYDMTALRKTWAACLTMHAACTAAPHLVIPHTGTNAHLGSNPVGYNSRIHGQSVLTMYHGCQCIIDEVRAG